MAGPGRRRPLGSNRSAAASEWCSPTVGLDALLVAGECQVVDREPYRYSVGDEDVDRDVEMLELSKLDLEEIATALADQTDYEHRWLIDPRSGDPATVMLCCPR